MQLELADRDQRDGGFSPLRISNPSVDAVAGPHEGAETAVRLVLPSSPFYR